MPEARWTNAGAPIVSICGGEPMIYPEIGELVAQDPPAPQAHLPLHERHVHHASGCTNSGRRAGSSSTSISTAWRRRTTRPSSATGVFDEAIEGIKAAKKAGFLVCTNTTIYKETDLARSTELFAFLTKLKVDSFMLSPAYGYAAVQQTNPTGAAEIFLTRDQITAKFREARSVLGKYRLDTSPVYLEFLAGERELTCTAWGNPTRNVKGWKGPCYLITDEHHDSFDGLMNDTDWSKYGRGQGPALRALHGPLRLRAVGGARRECQVERPAEDVGVATLVTAGSP